MDRVTPGFTFEVNANTAYELRELLGEAHEKITDLYDRVNSAIHGAERESAFIRYCFTGKFD